MENGDETLASPTAAAAAAPEKAVPNGGAAGEEVTVTDAVHPAKSYAAVAANAEIEDLRLTKHELEEQLANASRENKTLAAEAHRLEGLFSQAREEVATAEHAAASSEEEVASLRAEVGRLQGLKQKNLERETDERQREALAAEVEAVRQAKLKLEKEIEDLKASAAAATVEEREAAPAAVVQQKGEEIAWQGMAAAAAAGAAATAAVVLIYLRLKSLASGEKDQNMAWIKLLS